MYPHELEQFIRERNYCLNQFDLLRAISTKENPQLNHIIYNPYDNKYKMWDRYGNYYSFSTYQRTRKK